MNFGIYVVYDSLSCRYLHLFVEDNDATAQRTFVSWCERIPQPETYKLFYAAEWNNDSGMITGEQLRFVADGQKELCYG